MEPLDTPEPDPLSNSPTYTVALFQQLLSPDDVLMLSFYLFDEQTQQEIAESVGRPRSTVSYRVRKAAERLRDHGVPVPMFRGKGRRRTSTNATSVDPADMENLTIKSSFRGVISARWMPAAKLDQVK